MLRLAALVLLLANGLLLAMHGGWIDRWLGRPPGGGVREPERLARQLNPQAVQLLPVAASGAGPAAPAAPATAPSTAQSSAPPSAPSASAPAPAASAGAPAPAAASAAPATAPAAAAAGSAPARAASKSAPASAVAASAGPACLEVGPLDKARLAEAQRTLLAAGVAAPSWTTQALPAPPSFLIYMGRFPDQAGLQRKLDELRQLKVPAVALQDAPALQPGLVLGRHPSADAAEAALAGLAQRGVRTARVVPAPARPSTAVLLRLPAADAALRARLDGLRLPGGLALAPCTVDAAAAAASAGR